MGHKLGIYARISFDWEGKQLGIDRQCEDGRRVAEARGWEIGDEYLDNNLSAFERDLHRPHFERLLADLASGQIDGIIVYDLDRLTRQPEQLERIVRIYESRPGLVFATVEHDIDLSTSDGKTMARVMIAFANKASMDTSRRQKRKNIQRAEMGLPHGSRRPFGYEADMLTIRDTEAAVLRDMAARIMTGHSYKDVAYYLNEQKITTTTGKLWFPITVRNMLLKKRYAGIRTHGDVDYPAVWPPIFDASTWERLQLTMRLRSEGKRQTVTPRGRKYLLTGLVYCGKCHMPLNGATKRDNPSRPLRRTYHCRCSGDTQRERGCGGVVRNADALEHFVKEVVLFRLDTPDLAALLHANADSDVGISQLLADRTAHLLRIDGLVDDYATGLLTRDQLARAKATAESELARIEHEISQLSERRKATGLVSAGQTVRQAWDESNSDDWKRALMSLLIKRIDVKVGKTKPFYQMPDGSVARFDPSLIEIEWIA